MFWPDLPKGRAKIGDGWGLLQESASSDWKATATNQMYSNDLEACEMKCCYFLFHSEVNFFMRSLFSGERQWPFGPLVQIISIQMYKVQTYCSHRAPCSPEIQSYHSERKVKAHYMYE